MIEKNVEENLQHSFLLSCQQKVEDLEKSEIKIFKMLYDEKVFSWLVEQKKKQKKKITVRCQTKNRQRRKQDDVTNKNSKKSIRFASHVRITTKWKPWVRILLG